MSYRLFPWKYQFLQTKLPSKQHKHMIISQLFPTPLAYRNNILKMAFEANWADRWAKTTTCKHTKLFLPHLQTEAQITKTLSLTKVDLTKYIKIITNHNLYSYFQFKSNPEVNPLCRLCGEDNKTAHHFLANCPPLITHRLNIFHTYQGLSLIHISEPTRQAEISYAVFC